MIIKEISTQGKDENEKPLFLIRNSKDYPPETWEMILKYLEINKRAHLLKYEIIEQ